MNKVKYCDSIRIIACDGYNYYLCSSIRSLVNYLNEQNVIISSKRLSKLLKLTSTYYEYDFANIDDVWYVRIMDEYDYQQEISKYKVFVAPGIYLKAYC